MEPMVGRVKRYGQSGASGVEKLDCCLIELMARDRSRPCLNTLIASFVR